MNGRQDSDRGRGLELEPMGVIDIGSNSVRLVVYEGAVRAPTSIFNEKVLAGLGRTVATTGRLGDEAVERALVALRRFRAITRILGVKNVRAIATAACREASNGPDFLRRASEAAGVKVDVLSGAEEAEYAAAGIQMGFHDPNGIAGDLGGGSLELIDISGQKMRDATTLPLGGLRLIDTSNDKIDRALDIVDAEIAKVGWLTQGRDRTFYAVGGTWRAFAKLHMEANDYPLRVMHGYAVPTNKVIDFAEDVRKAKKVSSLKGGETIAKARREVLPQGALVLERLLKRMQPKEVVFSVFGIREGLLYKLLAAREQKRDPLLSFAADYARLRSRSLTHAHELAAWTDGLFVEPGPKETDDERRLRHAACLMSDISWRTHPDYRGEQSLSLVAHAALAGIDHPGRVFLALAIYYRNDGQSEERGFAQAFSNRLEKLVTPRMLRRARIVGAAVRAAHMVSIGRPGLIDEVPMGYERGALVVTLPRQHARLDGERLRRRFEDLAKLVDKPLEFRVAK